MAKVKSRIVCGQGFCLGLANTAYFSQEPSRLNFVEKAGQPKEVFPKN
jgi:hypothetical protein